VFDGRPGPGTPIPVQEPGLDEHQWASRYAALEEDVRDAPAESLPELDELVAEMMEARGLPLEEEPGDDTTEPETIRQFAEARRVTRLVDGGESYDPGDVANAVDAYRSLYNYLLNLGPTSGTPA
jgi:hypothetical protein